MRENGMHDRILDEASQQIKAVEAERIKPKEKRIQPKHEAVLESTG